MVDAGILVFAAFITPYRESRRFVRELMSDVPYYECYVRCGIKTCEARDPKGLYRRARAGELPNKTGISAPYEPPDCPDLIMETDQNPLEQCVDRLLRFLVDREIIMLQETVPINQ